MNPLMNVIEVFHPETTLAEGGIVYPNREISKNVHFRNIILFMELS